MLLVVIGAGASYDSAASYPVSDPQRLHSHDPLVEQSRPPLANGLFENRGWFAEALKRFPRCQAVVPYLRHLPQVKGVEQVLAKYLKEADRFPERHRQIMAVRYYLAYIMAHCEVQWETIHKGVTNQKALLDCIESWRYQNNESVCIVTFNYDTMIENACRGIGVIFQTLGDYVKGGEYKLYKLHGSIDWGRCVELPLQLLQDISPQAVANELVVRAADLRLMKKWSLVSGQPPMPPQSVSVAVCPAIAIPIEDKNEFECPPEHVESLKQCLPSATKMLTIGWRATEAHFLRLLKEGLPEGIPIMVVAGSFEGAKEVAIKLRGSTANILPASGGFTDSILSRAIESFVWGRQHG